MADFFDGKYIRKSVNTPDGLDAGWIVINGPGAVTPPACDSKYWKIVDNSIEEMSQAEKDAVDALLVPEKTMEAILDSVVDGLDEAAEDAFYDAFDQIPSFGLLLRNNKKQKALRRLNQAKTRGVITQAQYDKILGAL